MDRNAELGISIERRGELYVVLIILVINRLINGSQGDIISVVMTGSARGPSGIPETYEEKIGRFRSLNDAASTRSKASPGIPHWYSESATRLLLSKYQTSYVFEIG